MSFDNYFNEPEKYYLNDQNYTECQLITAINAAICLCELPVLQGSIEYERLVDMICARCGGAISIEKAWEYLRLKPFNDTFSWKNLNSYLHGQRINTKNPVEFSLLKKFRHSVLAIDCEKRKGQKYVRVLNPGFHTVGELPTKDGWLKWEPLVRYAKKWNNGKMPKYFRVFKLDPWYIRQLQIEKNQKIIKVEE